MTHYSTDKVLQVMKDYHIYKRTVAEYRKEYASVGVTEYSEEATMPRADTISDVTATEAIGQVEELKIISCMRTDIKYIDDRLDRVTDVKDIEILALRLEGLTVRDIANEIKSKRSNVHRQLIHIAEQINGTALRRIMYKYKDLL